MDAHLQRLYDWNPASRQLSTVSTNPVEPVNLAVDQVGNLLVISYAGNGVVYALSPSGQFTRLQPAALADPSGKSFYLPISDWHLNLNSLTHPVANFISPDETVAIPVGRDFLTGATSSGVKSSPQIRSFGLDRVVPGKPFYITEEAQLRTWAADANQDGSLTNFRLFAEQGGEGVTVDSQGNVYIAAGQIQVYDPAGKPIDIIEVPERPLQLLFGGVGHKTLFIAARTSIYSVQMNHAGRS